MTAEQLFRHQLDEAGSMLQIVLSSFDRESADTSIAGMMSPRQQATHLIHCYFAAQDVAAGRKADWSSYKVSETDWDDLRNRVTMERKQAISAYGEFTDQGLKDANSYILGHDHYHIGQLCAIRIASDPSWDPYAIYAGH